MKQEKERVLGGRIDIFCGVNTQRRIKKLAELEQGDRMVKLQVDDIVIRYKSVMDLHRKIYRALGKISAKQTKLENEMKLLKKK